MSGYSVKHDAMYDDMIKEMLQFGEFQESVRLRLRAYSGEVLSINEFRIINDLFDIYMSQQVME